MKKLSVVVFLLSMFRVVSADFIEIYNTDGDLLYNGEFGPGVVISDICFRNAEMSGLDLSGTSFDFCFFEGANFRGAKYR